MTRTQFEEEIVDWTDLVDFCRQYDLATCEDIYDAEEMDERINDEIATGCYNWRDLVDDLRSIDQDWEYYRFHGSLDYEYMNDNDFERYKDAAFDEADRYDIFEDEDEETDDDVFNTTDVFDTVQPVPTSAPPASPEPPDPTDLPAFFTADDLLGLYRGTSDTMAAYAEACRQAEAARARDEAATIDQLYNIPA
jgi:hypothetical protein